MLYLLFLILAIAYNLRKFKRERGEILTSLLEAKSEAHRKMILSHHFYIFIFESFISVIVAHFMTEKSMGLGMVGLGSIYVGLLIFGFGVYQIMIRHIEKLSGLELQGPFRRHIIQEVRVNFALIMLPILIYSLINMTFQDGIYEDWGSLWFVGLIFNILFVSVLTLVCSVIIMLKLIPNREIMEPEYLSIINKRLEQIGMPDLRVRWIETDIKNAFVAGLKLFRFSNQTLFVGRRLRTMLTLEEFDAVICHELAHVANRHIHKRMMELLKNFLSVLMGTGLIMLFVVGGTYLYWGEDASLHTSSTAILTAGLILFWIALNFAFLFDTIRSHEYEADAYAVLHLGADFDAMKSSLEKLLAPEELPDYLKAKMKAPEERSLFVSHIKRHYSTHPELDQRIESLRNKMLHNLPFDFYLSKAQKMRSEISALFRWRILVPTSFVLAGFMGYSLHSYRLGLRTIALIEKSSAEKIMQKEDLMSRINKRPTLIGPTLMFYVVKKGNQELIEHFVKHGAEKGRTLVYLAQLKDFELFEKYYDRYHQQITDEEYFLILRKSAQVHFTDGYRKLVNARRFETLDPFYKQDIANFHKTEGSRAPASVKK